MPRKSLIESAVVLRHVMVRGIERRTVFGDDTDRNHFMERLGGILRETKTICYALSLVPNHFDLLLRTGPVPISRVTRRLLTGYALGYNRRYRRHGHLLQNCFKLILCQEEIFFWHLYDTFTSALFEWALWGTSMNWAGTHTVAAKWSWGR
jgi:putative transposase